MNEKERLEQLEKLLGKKPKAADLARYLGVARATVSGYPEKKRELMLLGLWIKKYLENENENEKGKGNENKSYTYHFFTK